jgi:hypothetical protein
MNVELRIIKLENSHCRQTLLFPTQKLKTYVKGRPEIGVPRNGKGQG